MRLNNFWLRTLARTFMVTTAFCVITHINTAKVDAQPSLTPAERWILKKVAAGEDADLKTNFPQDADRVISPSFVKKLLTNSGVSIRPYGVRIWNAVIKGDLNLTNEEIPFTTGFNDCLFEGDVIFTGAHFKRSLYFYRATFKGLVALNFVVIDANLEGDNAHFENNTEVTFENMRVSGPVLLAKTSFAGAARFFGMNAGDNLNLAGVRFNSSELVDFELMKVKGHASFNEAVFNGPARFYRAEVTNQLEIRRAQFNDKEKGANFEGLSADAVNFEQTVFAGPVLFYRVNVGTNFEANGTRFDDTTTGTNFERMTVNGYALFYNTVFAGPARFYRTTVIDNFQTHNATFNRDVNFSGMRADSVGFSGTTFQGPIFLDDMTYGQLTDGAAGANKLREMIRDAASSTGAHAALQEYHQRRGDLSSADEIYIDQRRSETKKLPWGARWFASGMFDFFVGYGRRLWRVLIWTSIIVAFGWFVFRSRAVMQPQKGGDESRPYSGFLYSLDLLLPIIDLQTASAWTPKPDQTLARWYVPVHVILGWILATFLVAALTGILK